MRCISSIYTDGPSIPHPAHRSIQFFSGILEDIIIFDIIYFRTSEYILNCSEKISNVCDQFLETEINCPEIEAKLSQQLNQSHLLRITRWSNHAFSLIISTTIIIKLCFLKTEKEDQHNKNADTDTDEDE